MKKKLFAIILSVAILLSTVAGLSEVSFAQDEKYVLSMDGEVVRKFTGANELIDYMNDKSHFDENKSYTLTLNDNLEIPAENRALRTLEIHCNLTIEGEGNGKKITGAYTRDDGSRLIEIKLAKVNVTINNLIFDGSVNRRPKHTGIKFDNVRKVDKFNKDDPFNVTINNCRFENCYQYVYERKKHITTGGAISFTFREPSDKNKIININNSTFNNCKAVHGGAICIEGPAEVSLVDTSISNCIAAGHPEVRGACSGGAIYASGVKRLELKSKDKRSSITSCDGGTFGGAICTSDSSADKNDGLVISNYEIKDCESTNGGAIHKYSGTVTFDNLTIENCKAIFGGAIHGSLLNGSIKNSKFINNEARHPDYPEATGNLGGAILNLQWGGLSQKPEYEKLVIEDSKFEGNKASVGGAIFFGSLYSGIEIKGGTVFSNNESLQGGAICLSAGTMDIEKTEIKSNKVISNEKEKDSGNGAAIYAGPADYSKDTDPRKLNISKESVITDNKAEKFGGGIYSYKGTVNIDSSTIEKNTALNGGGIYISSSKNTITGSNIIDNKAEKFGGGIYNEDSKLSIDKSTIEKNSALNGGGIYIDKGTMNLDNTVVNDNKARFSLVEEEDSTGAKINVITGKGAGLYINAAGDTQNKITNTKFTKNKADAVGGGIYLLGAIYELNNEKLYTDNKVYNYLKKLPQYIKLNNATFKGNTAGFGYYNPPYEIESIKDAVSDADYKALMSEKNSCKDKLIIKDKNNKWQHIESLINNYDIDYINPITTTTYMENFGRNGIYVHQELDTKDYQDQDPDANVSKSRDITVLSYENTKLRKNPDAPYICWNTEKDGKDINGKNYNAGDIINEHKGNFTLFAQWGAASPAKLILTLDENYKGGKITDYDVMKGEAIDPYLYRPKRRGFTFKGWSYNKKHLDKVHYDDRIYEPTTVYAIWDEVEEEPEEIKGMTHKAYIFGYPDGTVRPNGEITRAEAAAMLARLLEIESIGSADKPMFPDTPSAWYNKAINAVVQRGIMKGYPDGTFKPNAPITRAEFTQMISTIDNKPYGTAPFADVVGHWAERPIGSEYQAGRILGYPDGKFRPDHHITRCEAAVILNKIFERNFDAMSLMKCKNPMMIKYFIDLDANFWGYNELVEATNDHEYVRRVKGRVEEDWLLIK